MGPGLTHGDDSGKIDLSITPGTRRSPLARLTDVTGVIGDKPTTKVSLSFADIAKTRKVTLPFGATFDALGGPFYDWPSQGAFAKQVASVDFHMFAPQGSNFIRSLLLSKDRLDLMKTQSGAHYPILTNWNQKD